MSRDPLLFLTDIERSCERIVRYTESLDRTEFFRDEMRFDAVLHNLLVLGEAIKKMPQAIRLRYPDVAWREIAGMRDFVAHEYFGLDHSILWDAVRHDVPELLGHIRDIRSKEDPQIFI